MASRHDSTSVEKTRDKWALFGPSLANFTVQYNFQVIAIALAIAQRDMPQKTWVKTQDKSVIFIGCILGQFTMGYAGDLLGRARALSLTLCLAVFGALGSSLGPWGNVTDIYSTVIAFRFIIGFGLGGVYPLSATKAAEADGADASLPAADRRANAIGRSARAFFWQGPGMCAPYLLAILLRWWWHSNEQGFQWHLLLGLGALPAAVVVYTTDYGSDAAPAGDPASPGSPTHDRQATTNAWLAKALRDPKQWKAFLGTGGGWFAYDVAFYGFSLMGPVIVDSCFHGADSIEKVSWQQLVALAFSVPALLFSSSARRRPVPEGGDPGGALDRGRLKDTENSGAQVRALRALDRHQAVPGPGLLRHGRVLRALHRPALARLRPLDPLRLLLPPQLHAQRGPERHDVRAAVRDVPARDAVHDERPLVGGRQARRRPRHRGPPHPQAQLQPQRRPLLLLLRLRLRRPPHGVGRRGRRQGRPGRRRPRRAPPRQRRRRGGLSPRAELARNFPAP